MNWHVQVDSSVVKFLKRIPHKDADRLQIVLEELQFNPFAGDIVKLKGEDNSWRRRVGDFRIFFEVFNDRRIILIQEIRRRGSNTY